MCRANRGARRRRASRDFVSADRGASVSRARTLARITVIANQIEPEIIPEEGIADRDSRTPGCRMFWNHVIIHYRFIHRFLVVQLHPFTSILFAFAERPVQATRDEVRPAEALPRRAAATRQRAWPV